MDNPLIKFNRRLKQKRKKKKASLCKHCCNVNLKRKVESIKGDFKIKLNTYKTDTIINLL